MHSLQEGAVAGLGFCGACPTETETSRRETGFPKVFCAYKPICMDCTLLHNDGRSTVWCAYPKEERAVILRDPLFFNLPCRGRSDSASAGRVGSRRGQHTTHRRQPHGRHRHKPHPHNPPHPPLRRANTQWCPHGCGTPQKPPSASRPGTTTGRTKGTTRKTHPQ